MTHQSIAAGVTNDVIEQVVGWVAALFIIVLTIAYGVYFCTLTVVGAENHYPNLNMWVMIAVAVYLIFWTYWMDGEGDRDLLSNFQNFIDVIFVTFMVGFMLIFHENVNTEVSWFGMGCIAVAAVVVGFWRLARRHHNKRKARLYANLALQGIMVISYGPALYHMWFEATSRTESFGPWLIVLAGGIVSFWLARRGRDFLATCYTGRALIQVSVMLITMLWQEIRY